MSVNQQRIAEALNVSVMTVSRALRNHPDLSESTRKLILQKAEELGYYKHLKKIKTGQGNGNKAALQRMGILMFENEIINHHDLFKSGVVGRIFLSIQKECQSCGVETVIEAMTSGAEKVPMLVKNRSVDRIFLLGRYTESDVEKLDGIQALAVSNFIESACLPRVVADNYHGMREATEHLIALGHQRILFLGDNRMHTGIFQERSFGYTAAMQAHDLKSDVVFFNHLNEAVPVEHVRRNTAVVCSNDSLAYKVKASLLEAGMNLPEQCSLVSFDHIPVFQQGDWITAYEPDWDLLGRIASELMIKTPEHTLENGVAITVPGKLVIHQSTCPPPAP